MLFVYTFTGKIVKEKSVGCMSFKKYLVSKISKTNGIPSGIVAKIKSS